MIRVGRGEHIKCMTHKCVCASVPHQRPAERVASTAAGGMKKKRKKKKKKKEAISCFTWCGYPISYTKHVAKRMYANMPLFLIDVLSPGEPFCEYVAKPSDEILHFECNSFCMRH